MVIWKHKLICHFKEIKIQVLHRWNVLISKGIPTMGSLVELICARAMIDLFQFSSGKRTWEIKKANRRKCKCVNPPVDFFRSGSFDRPREIQMIIDRWSQREKEEEGDEYEMLVDSSMKWTLTVINNIITERLTFTHISNSRKRRGRRCKREDTCRRLSLIRCAYTYRLANTYSFIPPFALVRLVAFLCSFFPLSIIEDWFSLVATEQERMAFFLRFFLSPEQIGSESDYSYSLCTAMEKRREEERREKRNRQLRQREKDHYHDFDGTSCNLW